MAYGRAATAAELALARRHVAEMTRQHETHPPPAKQPPRPLLHKITSELTGEVSEFRQETGDPEFEPNLQPGDVKPATRALADFALVLLNGNEFLYVY